MVCSDAEQLVELAHVDVSIFLCILIVVILVHPDAYVDARFLMLVLAQGLTVHRLVHFSLLLSLLIIVNDLKLDRSWPQLRLLFDLLEWVISLQSFSINCNAFYSELFLSILSSLLRWVDVAHRTLRTHYVTVSLALSHRCRRVVLGKHLRALRRLDASVLSWRRLTLRRRSSSLLRCILSFLLLT